MDLIFYPNPILRKRAAPIARVDGAVAEKARRMFEVMYREKGVGLAAPQVGWSARLFVINPLGPEDLSGEKVYVNPEISLPDGPVEEVTDEEGCLSIPGVKGQVARHRRVRVKALDATGAPFEEEVSDLPARVVQHELDHLDGILFITRLSAGERMMANKVLKKLEKDYKEGRRPER